MSDEHVPDSRRIEHTAEYLKRSTTILDHELAAINVVELFRDHGVDDVFALLSHVDVINSRLHKQLVGWHTQFPEKPGLHDSDKFWRELKLLRAAKDQLDVLEQAIREEEEKRNTLSVQIVRSKESILSIEKYFDGYLDRVNKGD